MALDAQGLVTAFNAAGNGGNGIINGGVYLMRPAALLDLGFAAGDKVALEQDLFPRLLNTGKRLAGFISDTNFIDIGVPEDYYRASDVLPH